MIQEIIHGRSLISEEKEINQTVQAEGRAGAKIILHILQFLTLKYIDALLVALETIQCDFIYQFFRKEYNETANPNKTII